MRRTPLRSPPLAVAAFRLLFGRRSLSGRCSTFAGPHNITADVEVIKFKRSTRPTIDCSRPRSSTFLRRYGVSQFDVNPLRPCCLSSPGGQRSPLPYAAGKASLVVHAYWFVFGPPHRLLSLYILKSRLFFRGPPAEILTPPPGWCYSSVKNVDQVGVDRDSWVEWSWAAETAAGAGIAHRIARTNLSKLAESVRGATRVMSPFEACWARLSFSWN